MIILEATEVELEFEGEEEPGEGPNTVQAHVVVAGPRGGKRKRKGCKECGGHVTFLEAVEVEELDGVEEPDQGVIMVQARVVARLPGGKRKR